METGAGLEWYRKYFFLIKICDGGCWRQLENVSVLGMVPDFSSLVGFVMKGAVNSVRIFSVLGMMLNFFSWMGFVMRGAGDSVRFFWFWNGTINYFRG